MTRPLQSVIDPEIQGLAHATISAQIPCLPACLQAYAPLNISEHGVHCPERVLLLLACLNPKCGKLPTSWRLLRVQVPATSVSTCDVQKTASSSPGTTHDEQQPQHGVPASQAISNVHAVSAMNNHLELQTVMPVGYGDVDGFDDFGFDEEGTNAEEFGDVASNGTNNTPSASLQDNPNPSDSLPLATSAQKERCVTGVSAFDLSDLDAALNQIGMNGGKDEDSTTQTQDPTYDRIRSTESEQSLEASVSGVAAHESPCIANGGSLHMPCGGAELPAFYILALEEPSGECDCQHIC